ncbi:hypothetical protein [Micromonospora siamensis]|uniref:Uncharacterized protein n=1 Tax=Micromonospora siamensis TaxID=299152 RepID=A0A1C5HR75_9ACTN|nr:hypothetical protein [Micromonospora siamensis]SCG48500.1 hypothetical protein GA0074704_2192 [Micromonospora siamensis]
MPEDRATRRQAFDRLPGLAMFAVLWPVLTVLVALPMRWLFDRSEPFDEALLSAAQSVVWLGPVLVLTRNVGPDRRGAMDPDGAALRDALRQGEPPADERLRAALPAYLRRQRRATVAGLAVVVACCAALILLAAGQKIDWYWAVVYGLVAVVSAVVAAITLTRVRRLAQYRTDRLVA